MASYNTCGLILGHPFANLRTWGPGGHGTLYEPVLGEDGKWYTQVEGTTLFVVLWPAEKHVPYHSTTCYARPLMDDKVDYQYRAWQ